jgi:hypothetical protein
MPGGLACRIATTIALAACMLIMAGGCASKAPRSTRLASADLIEASAAMAAQLASSDWLTDRTPADLTFVITIDRVENLSSDVIPEHEQWFIVDRLRSQLPMQSLASDRALRFVIPAAKLASLQRVAPELADVGWEREPTHRMSGTFRSVTRTGRGGRTDLYQLDFEILDLTNGAHVWSGQYEIKRLAYGRSWD